MLHFSCDLCGTELGEQRFVVKLEVFPAFDPEEFDEEDLQADHLKQVSESLEAMESNGKSHLDDCAAKGFRFDLCSRCQRKFISDPLGRDAMRRLNFSEN